MPEFEQWLCEAGIHAPKLRKGTGVYGNCLAANEGISTGERFCWVPLRSIFTEAVARQSLVGQTIKRAIEEGKFRPLYDSQLPLGRLVMCLTMIASKHDHNSFWGPYMRAIPATYSSPLCWSSDNLRYLQGTNLEKAVPNKLRLLRNQYDNLFPCLTEFDPSVFPASVFTWDEMLWAHVAYSSRCFPGSVACSQPIERWAGEDVEPTDNGEEVAKTGCMVPWMCFMNHKYRTPITWITTTASSSPSSSLPLTCSSSVASTTTPSQIVFSSSSLSTPSSSDQPFLLSSPNSLSEACFVLESGQDIKAGSEVFNNYGAKGNEEFLLGYGFVEPSNPNDYYTVALANDPLLEEAKLSSTHYLTREGIPSSLLQALRVCALSEFEVNSSPNIFSSLEWVSHRNEIQIWATLRSLLLARVDRLHLSNEGEEGVLSPEAQMALIYRKGLSDILAECVGQVTRRAAEIAERAQEEEKACTLCSCVKQADDSGAHETWLQAHGGFTRLKPAADGRDLLVAFDCEPNEALVSIPASLLVTPSTLQASDSFKPVTQLVQGLDEKSLLVMFLLHELSKCAESLWAPFLTQIFAQPSVCPWLDEIELGVSQVGERIQGAREEMISDVREVYGQLFPKLTQIAPPLFSESVFTQSNFVFAAWLVETRSFPLLERSGPVNAWVPLLQVPVRSPLGAVSGTASPTGAFILSAPFALATGKCPRLAMSQTDTFLDLIVVHGQVLLPCPCFDLGLSIKRKRKSKKSDAKRRKESRTVALHTPTEAPLPTAVQNDTHGWSSLVVRLQSELKRSR